MKSRLFTKRKSVAHKPELKKIEYGSHKRLPPVEQDKLYNEIFEPAEIFKKNQKNVLCLSLLIFRQN